MLFILRIIIFRFSTWKHDGVQYNKKRWFKPGQSGSCNKPLLQALTKTPAPYFAKCFSPTPCAHVLELQINKHRDLSWFLLPRGCLMPKEQPLWVFSDWSDSHLRHSFSSSMHSCLHWDAQGWFTLGLTLVVNKKILPRSYSQVK